jgi:hypothetical protein
VNNPRAVLITIAILFLAPLALALMMRSGWWDFTPSRLSNRGTLVQPAMPLRADMTRALPGTEQDTRTRGQWTILYPLPTDCSTACQKTLAELRQVHLATGRERERVAIWLLAHASLETEQRESLLAIYPGFVWRLDPGGEARSMLAELSGAKGSAFGDARGQAFLLDPAANIILRYAPGFDPRDLSQDLDRLLTWTPDE